MITETGAPVRHLSKPAPILTAEDTISRAAEAMRSHQLGALAVAADGRVIGLIREEDLLEPLSRDPEGGRLLRVGEFAVGDPVTVPASASAQQAWRALQWTGSPALPVIEENGFYRGMIGRTELLGFWTRSVKPPRIGGMATPFGVYLTDYTVRGGVGDLGLMLTGASLGLISVVVEWAAGAGASTLERWTGWPVAALMASPPTSSLSWMDGVAVLYHLLPFLLMLVLIRLTPLAGYHAGEHQTVWAIERDEPLVPEVVERMPRPHPRCGTNLIVGVMLFETLKYVNPELALIAAVFFWRRIGYYVQLYLTTRPATRRQIESGIKAGTELLARYQAHVGLPAPRRFPGRLWNLGLAQVFIGYVLTASLFGMMLGIPLFAL